MRPGEGFRFGPAAPDDLDRLTDLRIAAMRASLERIGRFDPVRAGRRMLEQFQPQHTRLIWTGEVLAGRVAFPPDGPGRRLLRHFYLHPDHSGRGLGGGVMAVLMAEADAQRCTVELTVIRESDANRFYPRFGFVETSRDQVDIFYARAPGGQA